MLFFFVISYKRRAFADSTKFSFQEEEKFIRKLIKKFFFSPASLIKWIEELAKNDWFDRPISLFGISNKASLYISLQKSERLVTIEGENWKLKLKFTFERASIVFIRELRCWIIFNRITPPRLDYRYYVTRRHIFKRLYHI